MELTYKILFIVTFYFTIIIQITNIKHLFTISLADITAIIVFLFNKKSNWFTLFLHLSMWFYQIYFWFSYFKII